jgi:CHASE3 domain sensor protein
MGMSFRTRLVSGHIFLLLLIGGTAATAIVALRLTASDSERIAHMMSEELVAVERLRFQAEQVVATSRGYLLTGDSSSLERFDAGAFELSRSIRELRAHLDQVGAVLALAVAHSADNYVRASLEAARQRSLAGPDAVLPYFEANVRPRREEFEVQIRALSEYVHAKTDHALAASREFARVAQLVLVFASFSALGIGILLAVITIRRLSLHYARLQTAE